MAFFEQTRTRYDNRACWKCDRNRALALNEEVGKDISARRLNYLLREAEAETREALEPFGFYSPTITIQRSDRSSAQNVDEHDVDPANGDADAETAAALVEASWPAAQERAVIGSPHFFLSDDSWFCPGLDIERRGQHLHIEADEGPFREFLTQAFA